MGIGKELAKLFAKDGYDLIWWPATKNDLEAAADELKRDYDAQNVTVIPVDLSKRKRAGAIVRGSARPRAKRSCVGQQCGCRRAWRICRNGFG